ncbi:shikimate kinase [bacterium]|nr:shikimate kinase [bacterium]
MSQIPAARRNVYLVGFMGTGKTTIGRELARLMGRKFIDVDQEIERRFTLTVAEIFASRGESVFRQAEEDVALELSAETNRIVATGGGTILNPRIFDAFEGSGMLVCLYTQQQDLVDRLQRTDKRPLLKGQSEEEVRLRVERLLEERQVVYNKVAVRIDTTSLTPLSAARKIHDVVSVRQRVQRVRDALGGILDVT